MAFLFSSYILLFTIFSPLLGKVFDMYNAQGNIDMAFFWVVGIGFGVVAASIIFASTFIPENSCAVNPKITSSEEDGDVMLSVRNIYFLVVVVV
jgi:MFS family permease